MSEEKPILGFYHLSRAWYGPANLQQSSAGLIDEITIGLYYPSGGTAGEFALRWIRLGDELAMRLEVFYDGFTILAAMPEVIAELSKSGNMTPSQAADMLNGLGFTDLTPTSDTSTYAFPAPSLKSVATRVLESGVVEGSLRDDLRRAIASQT